MTFTCIARRALAGLLVATLAGCAQPPRAPASGQSWSGRLALQVQDTQPQSFSAGFELTGSPESGELRLFNPLGGVAAVLAWAPGSATLRAQGETKQFESLDALATHATGAPIPVAALFDWLRGNQAVVTGWQADLSQLGEGRLRAQRLQPPPPADLRLVIER